MRFSFCFSRVQHIVDMAGNVTIESTGSAIWMDVILPDELHDFSRWLPSGKRLHNYGKIHHAING